MLQLSHKLAAAAVLPPLIDGRRRDNNQCWLQYEDELLQALAQSVMPMDRLTKSVDKAAALSAAMGEQPVRQAEDLLAQELLGWFKHEFFTWVSRGAMHFSYSKVCLHARYTIRHWYCGVSACTNALGQPTSMRIREYQGPSNSPHTA